MKVSGLTVDTQKIADGLYDIICEKGEESIVAFGMIPLWIIELLEKQLRRKVIEIAAKQAQIPVEIYPVDEKLLHEILDPVVRQVSSDIYRSAKNAGKMCV